MKEFGGKLEGDKIEEATQPKTLEQPQLSREAREKFEKLTGMDKIPTLEEKLEGKEKIPVVVEGNKKTEISPEAQKKFNVLTGLNELPNNDENPRQALSMEDLKKYGLYKVNVSEDNGEKKDNRKDTGEQTQDYSKYLDKGKDGKWYDKETGKSYDSVDAWVKAQETLAKRYEGTAEYYKKKADKAWARYKNAEENGDSDAQKWKNKREAQECYAKAKECNDKAAAIREKLGQKPNEVSDENDKKDTSEPEKNTEQKDNEKNDKVNEQKDVNDGQPIKNKQDGLAREKEVEEELKDKYPEDEGYEILSEVYLRDKDGNIVRDPETGEARRIDFVVVKDGKVVDSVEVTSKTADKTEQSAKEERIRDAGGNYVRDNNGNLVEIPGEVTTRIERRD